ncbi:hypothetical protein SH668x_003389 [Planctomicrobium sp. SH668]|uniref:hypothetical protein n=1 Tax=Planctomicrobium sp. SH668 TaxID=3448126 RepID=UPI003F5B6AB7
MLGQPNWLKEFVDGICNCIYGADDLPPIGCHYAFEDDAWEITVFVSATEVVGGQFDGSRKFTPFAVDVVELVQMFHVVENTAWQPHPMSEDDELRSHLSVDGYYEGHKIWLRVLAETPEAYGVGRIVNELDGRTEDVWRE